MSYTKSGIFLLMILFFSYRVFSQVVIKDTINLEGLINRSNVLADEEPVMPASAYSITVSLNWDGIKTNYPEITLSLSGRDNVILNCLNYCFGSGYLPTTVDTSHKSSFSIKYKDNINSQLTVTTKLVPLSINRSLEPFVEQKFEIWFHYSNTQLSFKSGTVTVTKTTQGTPPALQYHCFSQADPLWGRKTYDHDSTAFMEDLACAVSGMAMILKSYGIDTDPGRLNDSMRVNGGFEGKNVSWEFIDRDLRNTMIKYGGMGGERIKMKNGKPDTSVLKSMKLSDLDFYINNGWPTLVQVFNQSTSNFHWVWLIGKDGSQSGANAYIIFDPGSTSYCSQTRSVANYQGVVYRFVYYQPK